MASIGHVVMGALGARVLDGAYRWRTVVALSAASLSPDLDVIAFRFGIPYAHDFGHRGASHSVLFAVLVAVLAWALTRSRRAAVVVGLVVVSHPLLDMLTDGGLGVGVLWPLSSERLFFPWRPIPVAPIGSGMLSRRGLSVVAVETISLGWLLVLAPVLARLRARPTPRG